MQEQLRPPETKLSEVIKGYAGLAAVILGVVYVYGALIKATQIHGANQSVTDTLPLIPLDQVLLAGINASLLLIAVALFSVLVILVIQETRERKRPRVENGDPKVGEQNRPARRNRGIRTSWLRRHARTISYLALGLGGLFVLLVSPPSMIVTTAYLGALLWWRWPPQISRQRWALVVAVLFMCVTLVQNYLNPVPLPKVVITKRDGQTVRGDLLVSTSTAWYVGTADHRFTAVQAAAIENTEIEARKRGNESVFELLTGEKLLGLPRE